MSTQQPTQLPAKPPTEPGGNLPTCERKGCQSVGLTGTYIHELGRYLQFCEEHRDGADWRDSYQPTNQPAAQPAEAHADE